MKKVLLFSLLVLLFMTSVSGEQQSLPKTDIINLIVDGGTTDISVTVDGNMTHVCRAIFALTFNDNALDVNAYGNGANGVLSTGVGMKYDNYFLFEKNITRNGDFSHWAFDIIYQQDEKNPKANVVTSRLSFNKFTEGGECLDISDGRDLEMTIGDNMTNSTFADVTEFSVTFEGYFDLGLGAGETPVLLANVAGAIGGLGDFAIDISPVLIIYFLTYPFMLSKYYDPTDTKRRIFGKVVMIGVFSLITSYIFYGLINSFFASANTKLLISAGIFMVANIIGTLYFMMKKDK